MNEINDTKPIPDEPKAYTLKILFGPMFGCELHLPVGDYFLIITPALTLQDVDADNMLNFVGEHAVSYTHNTLYIPGNTPSPNLVLRLSAPIEEEEEGKSNSSYNVDILNETECHSTLLRINEVFVYEHIRFAIKADDDEWSEDIKNFVLNPELSAGDSQQAVKRNHNLKKHYILVVCSITLFIVLLVSAIMLYKISERDHQILNLNNALSGSPTPLDIVRGRNDKHLYILTNDYQTMEWIQEGLFRLGKYHDAIPVLLYHEKNEVVDQLNNAGYPVLEIDYTQPQHPIIALWKTLSIKLQQQLIAMTMQKIPFADTVKTVVKTKAQLLQYAQESLARLHIDYRQLNTPGGYAFIIRGSLSDTSLTALNNFITTFNQQWGNRIINFSINMDENWLESKSYLDSSNGYLFINPLHWYFPLKHGDINV
ncbi:type III secretion system protein PrgH/EprH [Izhakiella capsodis]|uniref:Type III secretion system protein PrgH/EprH n=1 Tax=Izhakiella capsodis TaxID=1367852 RepID=A0A1I5AUW7_9GAMM|nr:PrgH/EprH family type III secretion apparatus protein [Izhakiella capsodis]SFN66243.1 type III secretion system protein PrgH/EprH [Izhakiella capsodis]